MLFWPLLDFITSDSNSRLTYMCFTVGSKRRMVVDHSRDPEPHRRSTSNVSSSTSSLGGLRRSVRDRLGPRPDINRR